MRLPNNKDSTTDTGTSSIDRSQYLHCLHIEIHSKTNLRDQL